MDSTELIITKKSKLYERIFGIPNANYPYGVGDSLDQLIDVVVLLEDVSSNKCIDNRFSTEIYKEIGSLSDKVIIISLMDAFHARLGLDLDAAKDAAQHVVDSLELTLVNTYQLLKNSSDSELTKIIEKSLKDAA